MTRPLLAALAAAALACQSGPTCPVAARAPDVGGEATTLTRASGGAQHREAEGGLGTPDCLACHSLHARRVLRGAPPARLDRG